MYSRPGSSEVIEDKLPMYDPHELLDYLWKTGRLNAKISTLQIHSCIHYSVFYSVYRFCAFISYPMPFKNIMLVSNIQFPMRKYWEHWSNVASWAAHHPGKDFNAMPVFIYGDEARYSETHGDKFIALCLGSPLVFKQRDWVTNSKSIISVGFLFMKWSYLFQNA